LNHLAATANRVQETNKDVQDILDGVLGLAHSWMCCQSCAFSGGWERHLGLSSLHLRSFSC